MTGGEIISRYSAGLERALVRILGKDKVLASPEARVCYAYDGSFAESLPDVVAKPSRVEEVARILEFAYREGIPVHPRGAGSGLSGGSVPSGGGIALVMADMNRIREISREDMLAVVEPGVVTGKLHRAVEERNLFYPPDPASSDFCTIGGNVAECAGGPRGLKYGVTRDYLLGLEVVLPGGEVVKAGGRAVKNVTGYDLARLFTGSEGTLGVITEATLRLIPRPPFKKTLLVVFDDLNRAGQAVAEITAAAVVPRTLEIMDRVSIAVVEKYASCGLPADADALLLIETDGFREAAEAEAAIVESACRRSGAREVRVAADEAEAQALWKARKAISPAVSQLKPTKISEDATVPRGKVPEMVRRLGEIRDKYGISMVIFGHAGDGNLHPSIAADRKDPAEMARVEEAVAEIFAAALELGGTLSGEHGIGILKASFLRSELGDAGLAIMRRVKDALDPKGIMGPGKVFPE